MFCEKEKNLGRVREMGVIILTRVVSRSLIESMSKERLERIENTIEIAGVDASRRKGKP